MGRRNQKGKDSDYFKEKYLEPKERLIQEASRNMMLSDEGDAYYRSQLKEKLKGKPRREAEGEAAFGMEENNFKL